MATAADERSPVQPMNGNEEADMDVEKNPVSTEKDINPSLEKHAHDADEALQAMEALQGEAITIDEETNKRLLKIIDWHLMPIMCCVYGMNYLDSMKCLSLASGNILTSGT